MSSIFGKPKQKLPAQQAEPEPIETVTEDAEVARRKERKRLVTGGRPSTFLSGIKNVLKKRLGE